MATVITKQGKDSKDHRFRRKRIQRLNDAFGYVNQSIFVFRDNELRPERREEQEGELSREK